MLRFECDYSEGCIDKIGKALAVTNLEQTPGYGLDPILKGHARSSAAYAGAMMLKFSFWSEVHRPT